MNDRIAQYGFATSHMAAPSCGLRDPPVLGSSPILSDATRKDYPALLRLEQRGWISSEWGISENNRRARFYSITRLGRKQLATEAHNWSRTVAMVNRMLEGES